MASFGRKANALCSRRFRESHKRAAGSSRKLISHFLLRHSSQPQCINEQEFLWFQFCLLFFLSQRTSKFLSKYKRRRKLDCGFQPPCFSLSFFLSVGTDVNFISAPLLKLKSLKSRDASSEIDQSRSIDQS